MIEILKGYWLLIVTAVVLAVVVWIALVLVVFA